MDLLFMSFRYSIIGLLLFFVKAPNPTQICLDEKCNKELFITAATRDHYDQPHTLSYKVGDRFSIFRVEYSEASYLWLAKKLGDSKDPNSKKAYVHKTSMNEYDYINFLEKCIEFNQTLFSVTDDLSSRTWRSAKPISCSDKLFSTIVTREYESLPKKDPSTVTETMQPENVMINSPPKTIPPVTTMETLKNIDSSEKPQDQPKGTIIPEKLPEILQKFDQKAAENIPTPTPVPNLQLNPDSAPEIIVNQTEQDYIKPEPNAIIEPKVHLNRKSEPIKMPDTVDTSLNFSGNMETEMKPESIDQDLDSSEQPQVLEDQKTEMPPLPVEEEIQEKKIEHRRDSRGKNEAKVDPIDKLLQEISSTTGQAINEPPQIQVDPKVEPELQIDPKLELPKLQVRTIDPKVDQPELQVKKTNRPELQPGKVDPKVEHLELQSVKNDPKVELRLEDLSRYGHSHNHVKKDALKIEHPELQVRTIDPKVKHPELKVLTIDEKDEQTEVEKAERPELQTQKIDPKAKHLELQAAKIDPKVDHPELQVPTIDPKVEHPELQFERPELQTEKIYPKADYLELQAGKIDPKIENAELKVLTIDPNVEQPELRVEQPELKTRKIDPKGELHHQDHSGHGHSHNHVKQDDPKVAHAHHQDDPSGHGHSRDQGHGHSKDQGHGHSHDHGHDHSHGHGHSHTPSTSEKFWHAAKKTKTFAVWIKETLKPVVVAIKFLLRPIHQMVPHEWHDFFGTRELLFSMLISVWLAYVIFAGCWAMLNQKTDDDMVTLCKFSELYTKFKAQEIEIEKLKRDGHAGQGQNEEVVNKAKALAESKAQECLRLLADIDRLTIENRDLHSEINKLKSDLQSSETKKPKVDKELENLRKQTSSLESEVKEYKSSFERERQLKEGLETALDAEKENSLRFKNDLKTCEEKCKELAGSLEQTDEDLKHFKQKCETLAVQCREFEGLKVVLSRQQGLKSKPADHSDGSASNGKDWDWAEDVSGAESDSETKQKLTDQTLSELAALGAELKEKLDEVQRLKLLSKDLMTDKQILEKSCEKLKTDNSTLNSLLKETNEKVHMLESKIKALKDIYEEKLEDMAKQKMDKEKQLGAMTGFEDEVARYRDESAMLRKTADELRQEVKELDSLLSRARNELDRVRHEAWSTTRRLEREKTAVQSENALLRARLVADLKSSAGGTASSPAGGEVLSNDSSENELAAIARAASGAGAAGAPAMLMPMYPPPPFLSGGLPGFGIPGPMSMGGSSSYYDFHSPIGSPRGEFYRDRNVERERDRNMERDRDRNDPMNESMRRRRRPKSTARSIDNDNLGGANNKYNRSRSPTPPPMMPTDRRSIGGGSSNEYNRNRRARSRGAQADDARNRSPSPPGVSDDRRRRPDRLESTSATSAATTATKATSNAKGSRKF